MNNLHHNTQEQGMNNIQAGKKGATSIANRQNTRVFIIE